MSNNSLRIVSIDVFRGITMFLLIAEFTELYSSLYHIFPNGSFGVRVIDQLHHHPWNGLRFWDLIQPFFMFIVGLSLPFAIKSRKSKGQDQQTITRHVVKRSIILILLGWYLYCIDPGRITFRFQNVLAQIGITYLITYLIFNKKINFQIAFSVALLVLSDLVYRVFPIDGYDKPFVLAQNFGTWLDLQYGGADLNGGWVSFNAIPTAAHTIWGMLIGKFLMSDQNPKIIIKKLVLFGGILVILGYALNPLIPMIKRISTSSFVLVSGGWSILALALLYWIIDIKKIGGKWIKFFTVVGINSLFIYLFAHIGGAHFIENIVHPVSNEALKMFGENTVNIATQIIVLAGLWGLCYWLYKKQLFIKI